MGALLNLVPSTRVGVKYPGGASKSERHFLDFVINGQSLWEKVGRPRDLVSVICYECGDIGCGAVTAMVVRDGQAIVWKDFGYENDYEEKVLLDDYKQVGPYTFDLAEYESTLFEAIESLKALKT